MDRYDGYTSYTIHDSGYKKLFSNTVIFRQLVESFVHEDWVKEIDFEQSETLDKSFVSDHYKETESDLIYKVTFRGGEAYLIILLEFQSSVERFMTLSTWTKLVAHFSCQIIEGLDVTHFSVHCFKIIRGKVVRFVKPLYPETRHISQRLYKQSQHYRVRQRAHCILLSAHGYRICLLMDIFNVSRRTMINWLNAWEARRLPGLYDLKGKGKKATFTPAQKEQIKRWSKRFPKNINRILALVQETFGISVGRRTIKRVLKALKCRWRRVRRTPKGKPTAKDYTQKQEELETFKQQEDVGKIALCYFDESGCCPTAPIPYAWQEIGQTIEVPSGDKRRLNVVGFLSRKQQ